MRWGEALRCTLLDPQWDQQARPRSLLLEFYQEGVRFFHQAWQPQWTGEAMETEGAGQTPLVSCCTTQELDPHVSKSDVSRLADRGTALGFGLKLLIYLEEVGFLMTHSGAEFRGGRSSDLRAGSNLL